MFFKIDNLTVATLKETQVLSSHRVIKVSDGTVIFQIYEHWRDCDRPDWEN